RSAEAVEVPLWVARAWLQQSFLPLANLSDAAEKEADLSASDRNRRVFRYAGADSRLTGAAYGRDLKDGDLIVVPANFGGCDEWGWKPEGTEPVTDVGDNAAWLFRARRFAVRVTPELLWQAFQREPSDNGIEPHRNIDRIRYSLCSTIAEHAE